jgi:flagellar biosynthesis/type III secretory pathway M-ring protein FliF/YscJ
MGQQQSSSSREPPQSHTIYKELNKNQKIVLLASYVLLIVIFAYIVWGSSSLKFLKKLKRKGKK